MGKTSHFPRLLPLRGEERPEGKESAWKMKQTWTRDYFTEDDGEIVPRTHQAMAFLSDTKDRGPPAQSQTWRTGEKVPFGQTHSLRAFEKLPLVQTQALRDFEKVSFMGGNLLSQLAVMPWDSNIL